MASKSLTGGLVDSSGNDDYGINYAYDVDNNHLLLVKDTDDVFVNQVFDCNIADELFILHGKIDTISKANCHRESKNLFVIGTIDGAKRYYIDK